MRPNLKYIGLLTFFTLFLFCFSIYAAQLLDRGAKVKFFVGKVMLKRGKSKKWKNIKIGMKLRSRDVIRTFVESRVDIETPEGTLINIQENTFFELAELFQNIRTKAQKTKLEVKTGSIWADIRKLTNWRSSFIVETPTATATIRGTEFGVIVRKGLSRFQVKEGSIEVANKAGGKPVYVFRNQEATVSAGEKGVKVETMKTGEAGKPGESIPMEISSPAEGAVLTTHVVPIIGKTDPGTIIKIEDGTDIIPEKDGSFKGQVTFPEGTLGHQKIVLTAILEGKILRKTLKILIKKPEPKKVTLSITEPVDGATITTAVVKVSGTVTPGAVVKFADGWEVVVKDGNFSVDYTLPDKKPGEYEIRLKAWAELEGPVADAVVKVKLIKPPKQMFIIINTPVDGEEFVKNNKIPVEGVTLPNTKITFGSGASLTADATGSFKGIYKLPRKYGNYDLAITAKSTTLQKGKTRKAIVKVKIVPVAGVCTVEILEPAQGAEVEPAFNVKGNVANMEGYSAVTVNGKPAQVSRHTFTASVTTGFTKGQGGRLALTVTSPQAGARLTQLPVIIKGKVSPPIAKVLIDGVKEGRVLSDGTFESEYPMSDETGDYDVVVSAVLEAGEEVKKKFDIIVQSKCGNIKPAPVKRTVIVNLGQAHASGETKQVVSFHYEKQKYPLMLSAGPAVCAGNKVRIDVQTNAVELRANDKIVPLPGVGGTVRSYRYELDNTDMACFPENEIVFSAFDESADPETKEISVTWNCPVVNVYKPELVVNKGSKNLFIQVFDKSFMCEKSEEEVQVTVEATGEGQIQELEFTRNGNTQPVSYIEGVNIQYLVKATDRGKNIVTRKVTKDGYIARDPRITLINPRNFYYTVTYPPGLTKDDEEIEFIFKIDNVEDYRLIKRVEFRPTPGPPEIFEGARIPTDLEFDDIYMNYKRINFSKKGDKKTINYLIKVTDITDRIVQRTGSISIIVK